MYSMKTWFWITVLATLFGLTTMSCSTQPTKCQGEICDGRVVK